MTPRLALSLSALFLLSACTGREAVTSYDLHKKRPGGPIVKSVKHFVTDSSGNEMLLEMEEFNKEGHRTKTTRYQAPGVLDFEAVYTPGEYGHPEKTITRYLDGSTETENHTYNSKGKAIKTEWKRSDGTAGRHEYKYDDHDSMVEWDRYQGGKYVMSQLWPNTYDELGRVTEAWYKETSNGHDTSTQSHWQYQYDSLGRLIHKMTLSGYALQFAEQYYYDSLGSPIMIIEYGIDSTQAGRYIPQKRTINTFSEYGEFLVSIVLDATGKELSRTENQYDRYGHLIRSIKTSSETATTNTQTDRWEYTF